MPSAKQSRVLDWNWTQLGPEQNAYYSLKRHRDVGMVGQFFSNAPSEYTPGARLSHERSLQWPPHCDDARYRVELLLPTPSTAARHCPIWRPAKQILPQYPLSLCHSPASSHRHIPLADLRELLPGEHHSL
jgi:hypothetical protein